MNILKEFFSLPVNLVKIAEIYDFPIYTSDSLKEKTIELLLNDKSIKNYSNILVRLIDNKILIPSWSDNNIIKLGLMKLTGNSYIRGLFIPTYGRVLLIMDGNTNIFSFTDDKVLISTTVHECLHLSANNGRDKFLKIWQHELDTFYTKLYSDLFVIPLDDNFEEVSKICNKIYTDLFFHCELYNKKIESTVVIEIYEKYRNILKKLSVLDSGTFQEIFNLLISFIKSFLEDISKLRSQYVTKYISVVKPLYSSYKNLSVKNASTMACQEYIYPSEVIAVLSGSIVKRIINNSKIKQSLLLIKD